jgi:hypothetical protein
VDALGNHLVVLFDDFGDVFAIRAIAKEGESHLYGVFRPVKASRSDLCRVVSAIWLRLFGLVGVNQEVGERGK